MYVVEYYVFNDKKLKTFKTLQEAFKFWEGLPFQTFQQLYRL